MCHDIYDRARRMDHRVDGKRLAAVSVYELEAKHLLPPHRGLLAVRDRQLDM